MKARTALHCAMMAVLSWVVSAQAASKTWDGGGGDNNWLTGLNWNLDTAPAASDLLFFAGSTQLTAANNFAANTAFNGLTFSNNAGAFTLTGNAINLGGNIADNSTSLQTINLNLALTATRSIDVASAGSLTIGGVISGGFGITKTGVGTVTLGGVNTFTGNLIVSGGTLSIGTINNASTAGVLGNNTTGVSLDSGTLQYTGASASSTRAFTMGNGGGGTFQIDTSGTTLSLSGVIVGSGNPLTKTGAGTLELNGGTANSYNGLTTVSAGTLLLNKTAGVNAIAGALTVGAGTLRLAANNQIVDGSVVTINNVAGVLDLNGSSETIATLSMTGGERDHGRRDFDFGRECHGS